MSNLHVSKNNLLVELFVEELPPKALKKLGESFAISIRSGLVEQRLVSPESKWEWYATPRRLAVHIANVSSHQASRAVEEKLMPASVGLDKDNQPTQALLKKLQGKNLIAEDASKSVKSDLTQNLIRKTEGNVEVLYFIWTDNGFSLDQVLGDIIEDALKKLPIPKVMTYQLEDGWESVNFVRPAHSLIVLHGKDVLTGVRTASNKLILGLEPGNTTQGHRFEAKNPTITLKNADTYAEQLLSEGAVIASFAERRAEIVKQLSEKAAKEGLKPIDDEALLDEVTALVERPNVLLGQFESEFLEVPQECLILTMKANQKYFPLLDANGKLTNKFLIVSNINPADPSAVIGGNERVVRPRLADAKFFFDQDRKKTLESRLPNLYKVVYHNLLGNQGERMERVRAIARDIGKFLLSEDAYYGDSLSGKSATAAKLSKADLLTDMVGEFPELQGIMGRYYAQHEKLDDEIAFAIEDHYKPRFSGDTLPRNQVGVVTALADKLETLIGMFGIGNIPTGDKDPFALRRHSLGILRLLDEKQLNIDLLTLLNIANNQLSNLGNYKRNDGVVIDFIHERAISLFTEQGYSREEIEAVLAINHIRINTVRNRLEAARAFSTLPEAPALAAANKRVTNILKKVEGEVKTEVSANLLQEPAEIALNEALSQVKPSADKLFEAGDYTASLQSLAALKAPVDAFFDNVMVNADDPALKANRLGLLATLHQTMNRVADLSKLAG